MLKFRGSVDSSHTSEDSYEMENFSVFPDDCSSTASSSPTSRPKTTNPLRSALTSQVSKNEAEEESKPVEIRTMRFSSVVHICLVLSRTELKPLMSDLFWNPEEYVKFKMDAVSELRAHLTANGISAKEAIFELYQPHEHERAQWLAQFHECEQRKEDTDAESSSTKSPSSIGDEDLCDLDDIYDSDDDDEPRIGDDANGLKLFSIKKTDVELRPSTRYQYNSTTTKALVKSHIGVTNTNQFQWAVSWKPKKLSQ